ncbi:hypothetical protein HY091_03040 [Candidatus Kaiserbacteria bacterium]|nr:hypothetical protein [Candidatus Kaiserbacteria bacterium]
MPPNSEPNKLSEGVAALEAGQAFPKTVAVSATIRDYDNEKVVLSFEPYKQGHCRIHKLQKTEVKHLTSELKKMSSTLTKHFRHQSVSRIACKPVHRSGEYATLFDGLSQDIDEILEVDYTGAGRVFGFLFQNTFNVVAVAKEHLR